MDTQSFFRSVGRILAAVVIVVVFVSLYLIISAITRFENNYSQLKREENEFSPVTNLLITCGDFTFTAVETRRAYESSFGIGIKAHIEPHYDFYLKKDNQSLFLDRDLSSGIPLETPIVTGLLYGENSNVNAGQSLLVKKEEISRSEFDTLSRCLLTRGEEIASIPFSTGDNSYSTNVEAPLVGIFLLDSYNDVHDDSSWSFKCMDGSSFELNLTSDFAPYVDRPRLEHVDANGKWIQWHVINADGSIESLNLVHERSDVKYADAELAADVGYALDSCTNTKGKNMVEYYRDIMSSIKTF